MRTFTSKHFFRVLSVLTMGNFFLPIVFENIIFPLNSMLFYFFAWIISLLIFFPRAIFYKSLTPVYAFAAIYFSFFETGLFIGLPGHNTISWISREIQALFFALLMLNYFYLSRDYKGLRSILLFTYVFVFITIITTIVGLQQFPYASRDLDGRLSSGEEYDLIAYYRSIGIAGFGFFYGFIFAIPAIIAFLKIRSIKKNQKAFIFLFIAVSFFAVVKAQFTTALLFFAIGMMLAIWTREEVKPTAKRLIIIMLVIIFIPEELLADGVLAFANLLGEGTLQSRLIDLSISLRFGVGTGDTHIDMRFSRIPFLLSNFFSSPIIGGGKSLEHNWWLDRLSMFGLLGTIPWVMIIWRQVKFNMQQLSIQNHPYYIITIIMFIAMGFIKNMGQTLMLIFVFFIVPATLYIKSYYFDNMDKKPNEEKIQ